MGNLCTRCGNTDKFFTKSKGPHLGLYCGKCKKWVKWIKNPSKYHEYEIDRTNYTLAESSNKEFSPVVSNTPITNAPIKINKVDDLPFC